MGPSESSNNGLVFIKNRKIDHGKSIDSMMNFPKDSKEMCGTLKFWHPHKTPPWSSPNISGDPSLSSYEKKMT